MRILTICSQPADGRTPARWPRNRRNSSGAVGWPEFDRERPVRIACAFNRLAPALAINRTGSILSKKHNRADVHSARAFDCGGRSTPSCGWLDQPDFGNYVTDRRKAVLTSKATRPSDPPSVVRFSLAQCQESLANRVRRDINGG
jgi:hypothetical protein